MEVYAAQNPGFGHQGDLDDYEAPPASVPAVVTNPEEIEEIKARLLSY